MNLRHITRFTYEFTNFQGWRVAISRQGTTLARYFSDKQYGSPELARDHALAFRDMVLNEINQNPGMTRDILYKYRVKPRKLQQADSLSSDIDTVRSQITAPYPSGNPVGLLNNLKKLCQYLQLDSVGMMKFSMYLLMLQSGTASALQQTAGSTTFADTEINKLISETNLQRIIDLLEHNTEPSISPNHTESPLYAAPEQVVSESLVPDEEIRAKESEQNMHNTSPPTCSVDEAAPQPTPQQQQLESQNVAHNMMPPRPSPPSAALFPPATSATQYPTTQPASSLHPPLKKRGISRNFAHSKPAHIAMGLEYADSRPPNVI